MNTLSEKKTSLAGQYLTFQLQSEIFGIPIQDVREINQHGEVTPVPHAPEGVKGVMNLRGKIIPVVGLRIKFGMPEQGLTKESCIIVIDSVAGQVGLVVDSVKEVIDLSANQIEASPHLTSSHQASLVRGVGKVEKQVVLLIEVKTAFVQDKLEELQGAAQGSNQKREHHHVENRDAVPLPQVLDSMCFRTR